MTEKTPSSTLETVVSDINWISEYSLGVGIDAMTGIQRASGVDPLKLKAATTKESDSRYKLITCSEELEEEIDVAAKVAYNCGEASVDASTSYLSKVKFSKTSVTLLAEFKEHFTDYDLPTEEGVNLTAEAKDKAQTDPAGFRTAYGDYFVAGYRRGALFRATYACQANSIESLQKFQAAIAGEIGEIFTSEGSAKFEDAAKANSVDVSCEVHIVGYKGTCPTPTTPEEIHKALEWFKDNMDHVKIQACLRHYCLVDAQLSNTVPVPAADFSELVDLYKKVWVMRAALKALDWPRWKNKYVTEVDDTANQVISSASDLVCDSDLRHSLEQKVEGVIGRMNQVVERYLFTQELAKVKQGSRGGAGGGTYSWLYGYTDLPSSITQPKLSHWQMNCHKKYTWPGWQKGSLEFNDLTQLVVGWRVDACWTDDSDGSWSLKKGGLGTSTVHARFKSQYDRGLSFDLHVWYVCKEDYNFAD